MISCTEMFKILEKTNLVPLELVCLVGSEGGSRTPLEAAVAPLDVAGWAPKEPLPAGRPPRGRSGGGLATAVKPPVLSETKAQWMSEGVIWAISIWSSNKLKGIKQNFLRWYMETFLF